MLFCSSFYLSRSTSWTVVVWEYWAPKTMFPVAPILPGTGLTLVDTQKREVKEEALFSSPLFTSSSHRFILYKPNLRSWQFGRVALPESNFGATVDERQGESELKS